MKYIKLFENSKPETLIPRPDGTGLLIQTGGYCNLETAIKFCPALQGYREAGYSDWRIPNKTELNWIYSKMIPGKYKFGKIYWSSSPSAFENDDTYYCLSFRSGEPLYCSNYDNNWTIYVRDLTAEEIEEYIMIQNAEKYNL